MAEIMNQLSPLCYRDWLGKVSELSLFFSPKTIKSPRFHGEYIKLQEFFGKHGMESAQTIRCEPTF